MCWFWFLQPFSAAVLLLHGNLASLPRILKSFQIIFGFHFLLLQVLYIWALLVPFPRGASLKRKSRNRWECRRPLPYVSPSRFSLACILWAKAILETFIFTCELIACVTRTNKPRDFTHIESTPNRLKMFKNHHWSQPRKRLDYFPKGRQVFIWWRTV